MLSHKPLPKKHGGLTGQRGVVMSSSWEDGWQAGWRSDRVIRRDGEFSYEELQRRWSPKYGVAYQGRRKKVDA